MRTEQIKEAIERIATPAGVTVPQIQDSACDLFGRTPSSADVVMALADLITRGAVRHVGETVYLTALDEVR